MTCDEAEILLHALIDNELDAGHARDVETHIAGCPDCAAALAAYREMSKAVAGMNLRYTAPPDCASASRPRCRNQRRKRCRCARAGAEPALGAAGLCHGLGGIGARRDRPGRDRAAQ